MRILYVHYKEPNYRPGGMEVHIVSSAHAIQSLGHEIQILPMLGDVAPTEEGQERQRSVLRKQIARFGYEPRCFCLYPMRLQKLWRMIKTFKPNVLLVR